MKLVHGARSHEHVLVWYWIMQMWPAIGHKVACLLRPLCDNCVVHGWSCVCKRASSAEMEFWPSSV